MKKKLDMKSTNGLIVAMLLIVGIAVAFWMLALGPKRDEAKKLDAEVEKLEASLALHRSEVDRGEEARRQFPRDYQRLVVLGKAVPNDDDTASLLVQVSSIAKRNEITFRDFKLSTAEGSEEAVATAPPEGASPSEAAAALLPLGATVGSAGLAVMPYTMTFEGNFFEIADFIKEVDQLVKTNNEGVAVDGRLITLDGFSLKPDEDLGFTFLEGTFGMTTYVTPPGEELPAGAEAPETATAAPAASIGETP